MNIESIRKEYKKGELNEAEVLKDPVDQFSAWFSEAINSGIDDVNAMTLATSNPDGFPSARIVLLKNFDKSGFYFYTNYNSRKAQELKQNPRASLLFFWKELERQVRIEGEVIFADAESSEEYFNSRSLESRISASISPQSDVVPSRQYLEDHWISYLKKVELEGINRPEHWGGYLLKPQRIEFWQGRANRLHDRIVFSKENDKWIIQCLAP